MKKFERAPAAPPQPGGGRSHMAHRLLREPRFGRRTAGFLCGTFAPSAAARFGSCAQRILWAHVYSGGAVVAMGGSPGFVGRMDTPWTCLLRWVVALDICTITSSSLGSPTTREDQGRREEVPPKLADGRARGPAAYLWLVVALPREYRPRQPPQRGPREIASMARPPSRAGGRGPSPEDTF